MTTFHRDSAAVSAVELGGGCPSYSEEEVRVALREVLLSDAFGMSKRCGNFLAYVVEHTLAGLPHELKERTIGVAVFGRQPSYDTSEDAVVRIKASEVRKRLGYYYAGSGAGAKLRITLPSGGYVPAFSKVDAFKPVEEKLAIVTSEPAIRAKAGADTLAADSNSLLVKSVATPWRKALGLLAAMLLIAAFVLGGMRVLRKPTVLGQFWSPVLRDPAPVFLVTAPAPTYIAYDSDEQSAKKQPTEYVLTTDQYVGQGDLLASDRISSMLRKVGHGYEMKMSHSLDFHDLSNHSIVLIGYSSTQWNAISKGFRFFIDDNNEGMITDRGEPTEWYPHHLTKDMHTDEDYAIVSRVFDPETRTMVVIVSGSTQYGTEGAADLVTNPKLLSDALRSAPRDWYKKNFQLVLHMKVIANAPGTPETIQSYFW